jgi:hypothetical protein
VLKSGSARIALAVWYKPPTSPHVLSGCLPYSCNGLRAFPQLPKRETLLNKREIEREGGETDRERERERERRSA